MNNTPFATNSLILNAFEFIKKKDFLKAKKLLEKAISINPEIFEANHNLAILNFQLGNLDDSILFFEKSKKLKPEFFSPFDNSKQLVSDSHSKLLQIFYLDRENEDLLVKLNQPLDRQSFNRFSVDPDEIDQIHKRD